ncbi:MAG: hypothetical protein AAF628_02000 [Planctomycetota bacterium]
MAPLLVLCSSFLAVCGVLLFCYCVRQRDHEHVDRLSLLPLEEDVDVAASERTRELSN